MVPNLQAVMNSSVTINTRRTFISVAVSSTQPNTWQSDWHSTLCWIILSLIYFVPCNPELCYSSGPLLVHNSWGLWLTALVVSCFLADFRVNQETKKRTDIYEREIQSSERERERERESERRSLVREKWMERWTVRFPKSRLG